MQTDGRKHSEDVKLNLTSEVSNPLRVRSSTLGSGLSPCVCAHYCINIRGRRFRNEFPVPVTPGWTAHSFADLKVHVSLTRSPRVREVTDFRLFISFNKYVCHS